MTSGAHGSEEFAALHAHNRDTVTLLLDRAQQQGTVRTDVVVEDLLFHLAALGRAVPALTLTSPDAWRRCLHLLLDALRIGEAHTAPGTTAHGGPARPTHRTGTVPRPVNLPGHTGRLQTGKAPSS